MYVFEDVYVLDIVVDGCPSKSIVIWVTHCYEFVSGSSVPRLGLSNAEFGRVVGFSFEECEEWFTLNDEDTIFPPFGEHSTDILRLWIVVGTIEGGSISTALSVAQRSDHILPISWEFFSVTMPVRVSGEGNFKTTPIEVDPLFCFVETVEAADIVVVVCRISDIAVGVFKEDVVCPICLDPRSIDVKCFDPFSCDAGPLSGVSFGHPGVFIAHPKVSHE